MKLLLSKKVRTSMAGRGCFAIVQHKTATVHRVWFGLRCTAKIWFLVVADQPIFAALNTLT